MTAAHKVPASRDVIVERMRPEQLGEAILSAVLDELPATAKWPPLEVSALREHCREHGHCTYAALRDGRAPDAASLEFVRDLAVRRAEQNVPLAMLLHTYRAGYRAVWSSIRRAAQAADADLDAVLATSGLAIEYFNTICTAATDAYVGAHERLVARGAQVRGRLVEDLLTGTLRHTDENAPQLAAHGLHRRAACRVIVAAPSEHGCVDDDALEAFDTTLRGGGRPPLTARVHDALVAVVPEREPAVTTIAVAIAALPGEDGWCVGVSTPYPDLDCVPPAYAEAQTAWRVATTRPPLVAFPDVALLDVMLAESSASARRVLPSWGATLRAEDGSGELVATLEAYLGHDLNVGRAAKQLGVHPNTVRYRLGRIEAISGTSTRDFHDLVQVYATIRLLRDAEI